MNNAPDNNFEYLAHPDEPEDNSRANLGTKFRQYFLSY